MTVPLPNGRMDWENERYLLQQFKEGNNRAYYVLFKAHYTSVWHFANHLIDNKEDAEDIVAQAFFKLWQQRNTFISIQKVKPFLLVVIRNACFDYLKHHKVKAKAMSELIFTADIVEDDVQANLMKAEVLQMAAREVEKLPIRMRKVFKLAFSSEPLDNAAIAARLNITESTVRVQKAKAIQIIKGALKQNNLLSFCLIALYLLYRYLQKVS